MPPGVDVRFPQLDACPTPSTSAERLAVELLAVGAVPSGRLCDRSLLR